MADVTKESLEQLKQRLDAADQRYVDVLLWDELSELGCDPPTVRVLVTALSAVWERLEAAERALSKMRSLMIAMRDSKRDAAGFVELYVADHYVKEIVEAFEAFEPLPRSDGEEAWNASADA
jgi:hypothetical protein